MEKEQYKREKKNLFTVCRSNIVDMMLYNMIEAQEGKAAVFGDKRCRFKDKKKNPAAVFSHLSLTALGKGSNLFCRQCEARPHVHPLPHPDWLND